MSGVHKAFARGFLGCVLAATGCSAAAAAESMERRVVAVYDCNTIIVQDPEGPKFVRLIGIEGPEEANPVSARARDRLAELVLDKDVTIRVGSAPEDDGNLLAKVMVTPPECPTCPKTLDVGMAQLTVGLARFARQATVQLDPEDSERYAFAEFEARARKAGLWSLQTGSLPKAKP
jgi:endonuclease YncB( thermonuclease family)